MNVKKVKRKNADRKYYILDLSNRITSIENHKFNKTESFLQVLVKDECLVGTIKSRGKNSKIDEMMNEMGFDWEPFSEHGHMRQSPYANVIMEALEKYAWQVAEQFSNDNNLPIYRISGVELFDPSHSEFKKQISLISKQPELYGAYCYNVVINARKQILRYSACTQKLSLAKGINLNERDLPIGLFEISRSYRFEKDNELKLCKRVRSFHLPETHILTNSISSSFKISLLIHQKIIDEIEKWDSDYELLCSMSMDFFKENLDFLGEIAKSVHKPILLKVYNEGFDCEDGINFGVEYKVFDTSGYPLEIATFQVDDGTASSAFNVTFKTSGGYEKPISTIHTVFPFSSIERSAYFFLDRAIRKETINSPIQLPFWIAPIQARVIAYDKGSLKAATLLTKELNLLNFRVDLDDREISYSAKRKQKDLRWIPYIISIGKSKKNLQNLSVESKTRRQVKNIMSKGDLIKIMKAETNRKIIVPRYFPMLISQRNDRLTKRISK